MLEKLDRESRRYKEAADEGEVQDMQDAAFNAGITAWHLADWVYYDMSENQRRERGLLTNFRKWARKECRALHLCRHIATASKHWIVDIDPDPNVGVITLAEAGAWSVYFIDQDNRIPAGQVFDAVWSFWNQFIRENNIAPGGLAQEPDTE